LERSQLPLSPIPAPGNAGLAIAAWNMLGGLDWAGLPIVADILGIEDVDGLIRDLITIREFDRQQQEA
jgi:hypothetical protein